MSSISQFINNLYCWIYCSYTLHILFHSESKITLFYLLSFDFILFQLLYHSLWFVMTRFITRCHLLPLVVTRCRSFSLAIICCHLLYDAWLLVAIRCTTGWHSFSLIVIRCLSLYHSLSIVITQCTTRLSFCTQSIILLF